MKALTRMEEQLADAVRGAGSLLEAQLAVSVFLAKKCAARMRFSVPVESFDPVAPTVSENRTLTSFPKQPPVSPRTKGEV